jgi:hypothetical protein
VSGHIAARRLIDLIAGSSSSPDRLEQPLSFQSKAFLGTMAFVSIAAVIIVLATGDLEPREPRGKCYVSSEC